MESTAIIAHVEQDTSAQTVNTKSTNAIQILARTARDALKPKMITNVIVLMDIKENNVKTTLIGALKCHAIMERHVSNRKMSSDVNVVQVGRARCAMLRWFHVKTQQ